MESQDFILQILQSPTTTQVSAGGILLVNVILILRGHLVPKIIVDELRKGYEQRVTQAAIRGDEYRDAWKEAMRTVNAQREQIDKLLTVGEFANHVFEAIPSPVPPHPSTTPQAGGSLTPEANV